jgi:two-component system nitrate/nitrite sensor histidine kinase NarX
MNIKRKFYLYLLATIGLAFPLAESIHLTYSSGESIFVIFLITIIAFYYYLYIRIRKDFLAPFSDLQRWVKDYKQNQNARLKDRDDSSFNIHYLPIQKEEKISPRRSSEENSPVICERY